MTLKVSPRLNIFTYLLKNQNVYKYSSVMFNIHVYDCTDVQTRLISLYLHPVGMIPLILYGFD